MYKKIFRAIILVFTFLLLNFFAFNATSVIKAEDLPANLYANAGKGKLYWALVNYGEDYVGNRQIVIDIEKDAIENQDIQIIGISETENASDSVFYKRNVNIEFSSKINYVMKNADYGEKYITIFLLAEPKNGQTIGTIIDKIIVKVDQKRNISQLNDEDFLIIKDVSDEDISKYPYNVHVTLNESTIEGNIDDYVLKGIKYKYGSEEEYLNGFKEENNKFYFTVPRNGTYTIIVEDIFGYSKTLTVEIDNIEDPEIYIDAVSEVDGYINHDYIMNVNVRYFQTNAIVDQNDLLKVEVSYNGGTFVSIKEDLYFNIKENGIYTINAETTKGSSASLILNIDNIDKEAPYVQVINNMTVYTESIHLFNPVNEVFAYDNVTSSENMIIELLYYWRLTNGEIYYTSSIEEARNYLYTVRDIDIRYKVSDEAGNVVEKDSHVISIDDTPPTVTYTKTKMTMYINDPFPTEEELIEAYGLIVDDNSLYPGSDRHISLDLQKMIEVLKNYADSNNRLNTLTPTTPTVIVLEVVDESSNYSNPISLELEIRARLVTVEPDDLYIVYGDDMIELTYHCVNRKGEIVADCQDEMLEGDALIVNLEIEGDGIYTGIYNISCNVSTPSRLYSTQCVEKTFEIKVRKIKIEADDQEKYYLDDDPELTYRIVDVCTNPTEEYKDYRCSLLPNDRFAGGLSRDMSEPSQDVWFDEVELKVLPRFITLGDLKIIEEYSGGVNNYELEFSGASFWIYPKEVNAFIQSQEKIYGEEDPSYTLRGCIGKKENIYFDRLTIDECIAEVNIKIERIVEGEIVKVNSNGEYIDYYEIGGSFDNRNYDVTFHTAYLTILKRDLEISVVGDLDENSNPTGKYTIYYEDDVPTIEVYDSSTGEHTGLVNNENLDIMDKFFYGEAGIFKGEKEISNYIDSIGLYRITKGTILVVNKDEEDSEVNYNIIFNEGTLEVIKKNIWIKIIRDLSRVYGDSDTYFNKEFLLANYPDSPYIILEANGRFIIEITPSLISGEEPYIPRDNEKMKYHLNKEEGIYVGLYDIFIEKLEGCENYDVNLYEKYKFEITKRDITFDINDASVIYKDVPDIFSYNIEKANNSLQYSDKVVGELQAEDFKNVGVYKIGLGSITIVDENEKDVSFNYNFIVNEGSLYVRQREVVIVVNDNQKKQYGEYDPILEFSVYHNGVLETIDESDYKGHLSREEGEVPEQYYKITIGTFSIALNGFDIDGVTKLGNYLITEFDCSNYFYIEKRVFTVAARDVESIYGNEYDIVLDVIEGSRATIGDYNDSFKIDGYPISDIFVGELEIPGVDGVGVYTISCESLKLVRKHTGEDVTNKYYNFTCTNGTLTIHPRIIKINPNDNQTKLYGDDDTGITYTYSPNLLMPTDEFIGELQREPRLVNDVYVTEEVGEYKIGLGTLRVNKNYELVLDGSKTFTIYPRVLNVVADSLTVYYGDEINLTYHIEGDGLANNPHLGIVDTIEGELNLNKPYIGYGVYTILGDNLVVSNIQNYTYTFSPGLLIVNKKLITITPSESTLYKIYGDEDPSEFLFTLDVAASYSGALAREEGENVGKYRILIGSLDFGINYDVQLVESYFTIMARIIEVSAINSSKIYNQKDPVFRYTYTGTLVGEDKFFGALTREKAGSEDGEKVGTYAILQGNLTLTNNYEIIYNPGVFTISYAEFTDIIIYSLTNNPYQIKGEEEEVRLYARFNDGADETHLKDVEWKITKILSSGSTSNIEFMKDSNNVISFTPSGSIGRYEISATYDGVIGIYDVVVEKSLFGNVYIRYVSGDVNQILGKESELIYSVIIPDTASSDSIVQWIVNDNIVTANSVRNTYFYYTPSLGKGEYTVRAKIGSKISDPLYFYVNNNNPPVITLIGDPVVYVEAKTGTYIEQYATVEDDIDGDISDTLVTTGTVDINVIGTYYIRYDAKDRHGNNAISVYRQVIVRDTTPPIVTLNSYNGSEHKEIILLYGEPYVEYGATAYDAYDDKEVEVTINNPIIYDKIGTYEVTYIAYDSSGNRGTATRKVQIIDNISPLITLIGDAITYVEVHTEFKDLGATVFDNVDGEFIIEATSIYYGGELVDKLDTSILGTYYVRYDYTDSSGNVGAGKVRTVIVRDTTPPVIQLLGTNPYIVRYAFPNINYVEPGAVAKDNYDEYVPVTITGELSHELGTYHIYYNAVDSNGNIAETVVRDVIVIDIDNPIIHFYDACPQYITIEALYEEYDTRCDVPGYGIWVEDDNQEDIEGLQNRVVVKGSVDSTTVGLYVITYDVTDAAGNSAVTLNRYVTVVDTTAPVIKLIGGDENGEQIVEVFESYEELGVEVYDRYDLYHNIEIVVRINHNINVNKLGEYIVTYNATDSNGNKAKPVVRKVYVKDTTPPVVTIIGDNPITLERGTDYVEYGATAIDNYDGPMKNIAIINAPTGKKLGTYEVIYRAIDSSGNIGEAIRIVEVVDTIPPIVLGVEDGKYYKTPVTIYFIPTVGTDEVLTGWLNGEIITSPYYVEEDGEYDLLVRDDAGNETRIWFAIDRTPPLILGVNDGEYTNREVVEITSNEKIKYFEYRYQNGDWIRVEEQKVSLTKEGVYRIYAVDMADNSSNIVTFVIDRTPPIYELNGVLNKGITDTDVILTTEAEVSVVVNSLYNIPTVYTFTNDQYYQVTLRDLAGNTVNLQFVINKSTRVAVSNKIISIYSQHDAIDKIRISGNYPRNSGYMIVKPDIDGGFIYVSGKLFSEDEYQKLTRGETIEFNAPYSDDTYMYAAFVVSADELNKFETQVVDDEDDKDNILGYIGAIAFIIGLFVFFFILFIKRRKKQVDEETQDETIIDDYY